MAEGIAAGLAQTILTQLGSLAHQEIGSAQGVKKEVRRLQNTLAAIKDVLPHAENLQLSNNDVKRWLRRIKDAAYDAEDVIDDFATEALRKKLVMQGSISKTVRHFASSSNPIILRFKIAHKIKEVRENLKDIFDDHQLFGLEKGFQENRGFISEGRQTHSYIPEGKIVGRDADKEKLVKLLLGSSGHDSLSVIPIQGMGGIGKTALAQIVYNDKRVIDSFTQNRMWVCVSDEFDLQKITEKIIRSGTDKECPYLDMDQLQSRLRQHLGGKRYLLVLDDIWNEELDKWEELRDLLIGGAAGSKIIVTTRSDKVGTLMGTTDVHRLSKLSEGDCWNLFKARAFKEGEEETDPEFMEIGREITKKCVGVPLAAKTLGGLCYQAKKKTWEFVRDSDLWRLPEEKNGILHALRISYNHLSFNLKQCFAYCSIFPKDYEIEKEMLIKLWIAQGFIPSFGENRLLEDIGNEYVEVLMWRSFFQEPEVDDCDNLFSFKMHDLVHDFAQSVAGVECFVVSSDNEKNFPEGVRHLFLNIDRPSSHFETPGIIPKPSEIRTLMFEFQIDFPIQTIFSSLKFLRVLKFKNDVIDRLPNSIDELKHLRYLQIGGERIRRLPESIMNLQNLQVLKLNCRSLEGLPSEIQKMISLRHIDLRNRYFDIGYGYTLSREEIFVSHMPLGLVKLKSLQTLSHFVVGKDKVGCDLNGLNGLTNLGGSLAISNLENMKTAMESKETNLKKKTNLQMLWLVWHEPSDYDITREAVSFEVLENLEPPSNLKMLAIFGYVDTRFPRWMMEPSLTLPNVVSIELRGCGKCEQLPRFSHLRFLKVLILGLMGGLRCMEGRPEKNQIKWYPSLTRLEIRDCYNLESWFPELSVTILFPSLLRLNIQNCPKLKNMPLLPSIINNLVLERTNAELVHSLVSNPSSFLTSLNTLLIRKCDDLESWPSWLVPQLTSLRNLTIGCTPSLPFLPKEIQHLPHLEYMGIYDYCEDALPEWMANITSLQRLWISSCPNLQILPEWVLTVNTTIQHLWIIKCPHLMRRYKEETSEDRHKIAHIPSDIFPNFLDYKSYYKTFH